MKNQILYLILFSTLFACGQVNNSENKKAQLIKDLSNSDSTIISLTNEEWKNILSPELYLISREKHTEKPFSGKYNDFDKKGTYYCAVCGNELFDSDSKFASSCGWPSFFEQKNKNSILFKTDNSYGMVREEAVCGKCGGHLGHLFDDGPEPTGKRYCMNSIALNFVPFNPDKTQQINKLDTIVLGGGCFWCVEAIYEELKGVNSVKSGFSGGNTINPTYKEVCTGTTNHAEVIELVYNPSIISFKDILKVFFSVHDPTTLNRQGADIGTQYRSVIYFTNATQAYIANKLIKELNSQHIYETSIVTKVEPLVKFYSAENYHQDYYQNNKNQNYCNLVIQPKLEKFEKVFSEFLK